MYRRAVPALLLLLELLVMAPPSNAQISLGPITVGAGLRTDFTHTDPDKATTSDSFAVDDIRLYVNGPVTKDIKFMFNTDYDSTSNKIEVLDAVGRFEFSPYFNIWAGRLLPPADRAELAGPFYAHDWAPFSDGIQNGHPSIYQGRDNGVVYWGDFMKKVKVSAGAFDGKSADGNADVIGAARVQIDFWDKEEGYYLNGTYYGDKNLLAIGGATQVQSKHTATTVDFLLERKLPIGGAFSIEAEYANYNRLGGYYAGYAKSRGQYILGSYILPKTLGPGKIELLGKYAKADFNHGPTANFDQKTTEVNINYLIKEFNARVMTFYKDTRFNGVQTNSWQLGVGLQLQI
ncbi:MAG TPA: hypothetical protein VHZ74_15950 [Bryobacteraceae bacterium]|jgi:hypothetical protein|nr:hypothetical protein [Bryobacteraceae bacterium]